jgi:DNA-binding beta-propeller fold protein YncE
MSPAFIHLPGIPRPGSADRCTRGSGRWARRAARAVAARPARVLRRLGHQVLPVAAVVLAALGLAVPAASADPGGLVFAGCIGNQSGCTPTNPAIALDNAHAVTVVGHQVYATSGRWGFFSAVSHFTTDLAGNLTFRGCIGDMPGCTATSPAAALDGAWQIAASPDGSQLYATSGIGSDVSHFTIDPAGNLTFAGCIGNLPGCTPTSPAAALHAASGVAVTPDGRQLYAASVYGNVVSHFTIDPAGNPSFAGCIGDLAGCTATSPAGALDGAHNVAITPDGAHLYVASEGQSGVPGGNAVSHLTIDSAGNLSFAGCIGDLAGCTPTSPINALDGASAVVVTPDGSHLYATSYLGNVVSHFQIDPFGNLGFAGCIGDRPGCTTTSPAGALDGAETVAVTTDGRHLYVASGGRSGMPGGNAVSHFTIGSFGDLSFAGCIGHLAGCTGTYPAGALDGAYGVAVTADGAHLYATSDYGNVVSHFKIAGFTAARR